MNSYNDIKKLVREVVETSEAGLWTERTTVPEPMSGQRWFIMTVNIGGDMTDENVQTMVTRLKEISLYSCEKDLQFLSVSHDRDFLNIVLFES